MADPACHACRATLKESDRFCAQCGQPIRRPRSAIVAQLICAGIIGLELLAMALMAGFVIPRLRGSMNGLGIPPSLFVRIVFNPALMLAFMGIVAVLGALATFAVRNVAFRAALVVVALMIGVAPMFATLAGIYVLTFEQAGAVSP